MAKKTVTSKTNPTLKRISEETVNSLNQKKKEFHNEDGSTKFTKELGKKFVEEVLYPNHLKATESTPEMNAQRKKAKKFFTPIAQSKDEFTKKCSTSKTVEEAHKKLLNLEKKKKY